jgi:hypothetical protein
MAGSEGASALTSFWSIFGGAASRKPNSFVRNVLMPPYMYEELCRTQEGVLTNNDVCVLRE